MYVFCVCLRQVEAALTTDDGNEDLLKLKSDLQVACYTLCRYTVLYTDIV